MTDMSAVRATHDPALVDNSQDIKFSALNTCPQPSDLALDSRVDLLDLQCVDAALISNPALFEVEIQSDASRSPRYLLPESLFELLDVGHKTLVL